MVFGIVFARGIGRYVAEVHLPVMLTLVASVVVILAAAVIASVVPATQRGTGERVGSTPFGIVRRGRTFQ